MTGMITTLTRPFRETREGLSDYLTVPLDYFDAASPQITLRVSSFPAKSQPSKGALLFHCGGPGSTDDCVLTGLTNPPGMGDAYDGYGLLGITQRGMNNPEPNKYSSGWLKFTPMPTDSSFLGCPNGTEFGPPENSTGPYDLYDFTTCDCNLPEDTWNTPLPTPYPDPGNQTQRLYWLEFTESRNRRCYSSPYWTLTNDAGKTFNFLDYVGTWMLDQDLDRLRAAIGADKLNIYGLSYGTAVAGSYAAVYPQNAGKMILNGNVGTTVDSGTRESLFNYGEAMSQCNTKLIDMCRRGIDGTDSDTFRNPERENLCLAGGHDYPYEALTTLWSRLEAGELSAAHIMSAQLRTTKAETSGFG